MPERKPERVWTELVKASELGVGDRVLQEGRWGRVIRSENPFEDYWFAVLEGEEVVNSDPNLGWKVVRIPAPVLEALERGVQQHPYR